VVQGDDKKGSRRPKDDHVFAVLGSIDEANARVGLAREHVENPQRKTELEAIQHTLFDAGAAVATPLDSSSKQKQSIVSFRTEKVGMTDRAGKRRRSGVALHSYSSHGAGVSQSRRFSNSKSGLMKWIRTSPS